MQGFGWLLFSFRGEIRRGEFLLGWILAPIVAFIIAYIFSYIYGFLIAGLCDPAELLRYITSASTISPDGKTYNLSIKNLNPFDSSIPFEIRKCLLAGMAPALLKLALLMWMTSAIYIKRYRNIGLPWVIALLILAIPYAMLAGFFIPDFAEVLNEISSKYKNHMVVGYTALFFFLFLMTFFVPLFWPGRKYR